jgi:hypothetical protein
MMNYASRALPTARLDWIAFDRGGVHILIDDNVIASNGKKLLPTLQHIKDSMVTT